MDLNILNTCFETTKDYHTIALYSHCIPLFLTILVSIFVLVKSKFSFLSKIFTAFTGSFCLWLIGDVVTWTSPNYHLVSFFWAPLDYLNIAFYILGAYFFVVLVTEKDLSKWAKLALVVATLPAWLITVTNNSISDFYQPVCEAYNSELLTELKLIIEYLIIAFIMVFAFLKGRKVVGAKRVQIIIVASALTLFFATFAVTEYISSQTGIYEINLYSLFVLPVFLFMIIYAVINLEIFKIKLIGSQLLAYTLVIMVGSQFFFLDNATDKTLTVLTFILSLGFGVLLVRSERREAKAREKIEKLAHDLELANSQLKDLDRQKDELLSIVSHQLATPVSSVKWYLEMMKDGDLGKLTDEQLKHVTSMQEVSANLSDLVSMILDVSRIQLGKMHIEKQELDLNGFFKEILEIIEPKALEKKVSLVKMLPATLPIAKLDKRYTHMTIENLLSNAVKYTPEKGEVDFTVTITGNTLHCVVKDTGVGIPKADQEKIFGKLFRASNVRNTVDGNGFGLYVAKGAVEAQGGKIWFESEEGKGTTFFVELPLQ